MDSNEPHWADLGLSDFIDCGDSEKMLYKCNPLPSIRCPFVLISQKVHFRPLVYTHFLSCHPYTHTRHTNIYCCGISIRLWALVSCSYCKAEGPNETIIRAVKSRGPQMIRKSEREKKIKRKRGWGWKSPAIEPIHRSKPLLRAYFSPGGHCVFGVCVCESVCPAAGGVIWQTGGDGEGASNLYFFPFGLKIQIHLCQTVILKKKQRVMWPKERKKDKKKENLITMH